MKKKNEGHEENLDRWLLTYADLITLLMAFFTILYAMSTVDAKKFQQLSTSMSIAFGSGGGAPGNVLGSNSGSGIGMSDQQIMATLKQNNDFKAIIKLIREVAAKEKIPNVTIKATGRGLVIGFQNSVMFESGKADLSLKARALLNLIGPTLFSTGRAISVEGHTDNVPIHTARYESNWQLSTDRATNVIMYWISQDKSRAQYLSAAGYGEYRPLVPNDIEENRAKNRRVEIIIMGKLLPQKFEPITNPSSNNTTNPGNKDLIPH